MSHKSVARDLSRGDFGVSSFSTDLLTEETVLVENERASYRAARKSGAFLFLKPGGSR